MRRSARSCLPVALAAAALLLALPPVASAHVTEVIGPLTLTFGWGDEPAYSRTRNSVELALADRTGAPVADPAGSLTVEVFFGRARIVLPLRQTAVPGRFAAALVPTRPGTYGFHISGTVRGQAIDTSSTCSDRTFACVTDLSEIEFPAKDPSSAQVAEKLARALPRAEDRATGARNLALAALVLAALALAAAVAIAVRGRRKTPQGPIQKGGRVG